MAKNSQPLLTPLIPAIADALVQPHEVGLGFDDNLEQPTLIDRIPIRLAGALKDGRNYAVVMGIQEGRDWVCPLWDWWSNKPSPSWLRPRAKAVYDHCKQHGLEPYFSRGVADFGQHVQMLVPVDIKLINRLLTDYRRSLGGEALASGVPEGKIDMEFLLQVAAKRRVEREAAAAASKAAAEAAACAHAVSLAAQILASVPQMLLEAATAGADSCEIMRISEPYNPDVPACELKLKAGTVGQLVWDGLINDVGVKPVLGRDNVRSSFGSNPVDCGTTRTQSILVALREDFVPRISG